MHTRWLAAALTAALLPACETDPTGESPPPDCKGVSGCITTVIGTGKASTGDDDVAGWKSALYSPQDGTTGPDGKFYYLDWNNHRIRVWDPESDLTATIAGTTELGDLGHGGPALQATLNHPTGLAFDPVGRLVVAAWHNSRIKRVNLQTGILEDICGTGGRSYAGDGVPGGARKAVLDLPSSVALDSKGNVYISDQANERIRKVDLTDTITTVVGDLWLVDDDGEPLKDASGNYVDHQGRIKVTADGFLYEYDSDGVGHLVLDGEDNPVPYKGKFPLPHLDGGFAGDGGPASQARIFSPKGQQAHPAGRLHIGPDDVLYIADTGNHRIRKVDPKSGIISTIAGNGEPGYSGDGGPATAAQLNSPVDVDVLPDGGVLVADLMNHCVRVIRDGTIATFAGTCGKKGFSGDGGPATTAKLNRPYGVHVAEDGRVFIADTHNHRFRVVEP